MGPLLALYGFFRSLSGRHGDHLAAQRNVMFGQYRPAVKYFVVKIIGPVVK